MRIHVFDNTAWLFASDGKELVYSVGLPSLEVDILRACKEGYHCKRCDRFLRPDLLDRGCLYDGPHDVEVVKYV